MHSNDTLIEIYKLHAELADRISQRRNSGNQFYIGILSAIFLIFPIALTKDLIAQIDLYKLTALVSILGIVICVIWILNIAALRRLNAEKFVILHELESQLPFAFYQKEWRLLSARKHMGQSMTEKLIPIVFAVAFLGALTYSIFKLY
jgi:hypothetical protein